MEKRFSESDVFQLVGFKLGEEEYGIDILRVQEIIRMVEITKVPKSPAFVEGVINLRGRVIPIVDMRKRFSMEAKFDSNTRVIVTVIKNRRIGFIVDSVSKVIRIDKKALKEAPPISTGVDAAFILGVAQIEAKLLLIIDLNKMLNTKEATTLLSHVPS